MFLSFVSPPSPPEHKLCELVYFPSKMVFRDLFELTFLMVPGAKFSAHPAAYATPIDTCVTVVVQYVCLFWNTDIRTCILLTSHCDGTRRMNTP